MVRLAVVGHVGTAVALWDGAAVRTSSPGAAITLGVRGAPDGYASRGGVYELRLGSTDDGRACSRTHGEVLRCCWLVPHCFLPRDPARQRLPSKSDPNPSQIVPERL